MRWSASSSESRPLRNASLTACAMLAFAGNSLLCRAALRGSANVPARFTAVRLLSGAIVLRLRARGADGAFAPARRIAGLDARGVELALASGALASGAGYAIWYAVLPALRAVMAGAVQK